ncbi:hypothetical protein Tco_1418605 [Tanacetum coccineum]
MSNSSFSRSRANDSRVSNGSSSSNSSSSNNSFAMQQIACFSRGIEDIKMNKCESNEKLELLSAPVKAVEESLCH